MKRAIIRHKDGTLQSAMVALETPPGLNLGDRVTATRPLDLDHAAQITAGEKGTVVHLDAYSGTAEVLWDLIHKGLSYWDNHVLLVPFDTDDILSGLVSHPG